jgi:hypothetical protein
VPYGGILDSQSIGREIVMAITAQRKRALFWALGILSALVLMNVAWAQIANAIGNCFLRF